MNLYQIENVMLMIFGVRNMSTTEIIVLPDNELIKGIEEILYVFKIDNY